MLNQCNRMLEYNIVQKAGYHKNWNDRYYASSRHGGRVNFPGMISTNSTKLRLL
jgi:hypothetical protein